MSEKPHGSGQKKSNNHLIKRKKTNATAKYRSNWEKHGFLSVCIANGPIDNSPVLLQTSLCPLMTSKLIHSCPWRKLKASGNFINRGPSGTNILPDNNQLISMALSYRKPIQNMTWSRTHHPQYGHFFTCHFSYFLFMQVFKTSTAKAQKKLTNVHATRESWSGQVSYLPVTSHYTAATEPQRYSLLYSYMIICLAQCTLLNAL